MFEDLRKTAGVWGEEAVFAGSKTARAILGVRLAVVDVLVGVGGRMLAEPFGPGRTGHGALARYGKETAERER